MRENAPVAFGRAEWEVRDAVSGWHVYIMVLSWWSGHKGTIPVFIAGVRNVRSPDRKLFTRAGARTNAGIKAEDAPKKQA